MKNKSVNITAISGKIVDDRLNLTRLIWSSFVAIAVFLVLWIAAFRSPPALFSLADFAAGAPGTPFEAASRAFDLADCSPYPPYQTNTAVDGALCKGAAVSGTINIQFHYSELGELVVARSVIAPARPVFYGDLVTVYGVGEITVGTRSAGGRWYRVTWEHLGLTATIFTRQFGGVRPALEARVSSLLLFSTPGGR